MTLKEIAKTLYKDSAKLYLTSVKLHSKSKKTAKWRKKHEKASSKESARKFLKRHRADFRVADKLKREYAKVLEQIHKNLKTVESELKKIKL